jgi:hypothetical protein
MFGRRELQTQHLEEVCFGYICLSRGSARARAGDPGFQGGFKVNQEGRRLSVVQYSTDLMQRCG